MAGPSEREKMLSGEPYDASDTDLVQARFRARRLAARYNATDAEQIPERRAILEELLGSVGDSAWIEAPFQCDREPAHPLAELRPGQAPGAVDDCGPLRKGERAPLEKRERRQGRKVDVTRLG